MPIYETHDNGGRPFVVEVASKTVRVWKNKEGRDVKEVMKGKPLLQETPDTIFIGKKSPNGGYDGLESKEGIGNSILLEKGDKYTFIGDQIYEFEPVKGDKILKFYSNIGNSDVPYPYAIGETHVYILLDKVAVEKSYFNMKEDIYDQYYYEHRMGMYLRGYGRNEQVKKVLKDKDAIQARIREFQEKKVALETNQIVERLW